jgi:hypothetical protein
MWNKNINSADNIEQQKRNYVLDFLRDKKLIERQDNIIFSSKGFMVCSVLKWCFDRIQQKKLSTAQWDKYQKFINQYIAGIVELEWNGNNLKVVEVEKVEPKRTRKRR